MSALHPGTTETEGRSSYLDEDAGSLDSAGRRLALCEGDDGAPVPERIRLLADVGRFLDEFFQLTGAAGDSVRGRVEHLLGRQRDTVQRLRHEPGATAANVTATGSQTLQDRPFVQAACRKETIGGGWINWSL